ncbi:MAG: ShlB/FhaC/HecB family hemolysin secretion/activation protein [Gammaproteobacteria bacterium]|nr:ShlB/FhaC/HecB family hemolysin secretion/activation protein [Gammaproteobacteria bacterium]
MASRFVPAAWVLASLLACAECRAGAEPPAADEEKFDVWEIQVEGNTLLPTEDVERAVYEHLGPEHSLKDVQAAQQQLENLYHERGFGTVYVDIPEQDVVGGIVKLKVTEGKVGRLKVTGSRYFSLGRIKSKVPALAVGAVPYLPKVQAELAALGRLSPDRVVTPVLRPAKTPGRVEVELEVKDELPLHGSVELSDRYSADTTRTRLNFALRYDNLWQREHSVGVSYQLSPQRPDEVDVLSANYLWRFEESDNLLSFYGVRSNTNVATVGTLGVIGQGYIVGTRYTIPLRAVGNLYHGVTVGADYKDFGENIALQGNDALNTPISYLVLSADYSGAYYGKDWTSHFDVNLNTGTDALGNTQKEFERKRFRAIPNFVYLKVGGDTLAPLWRGSRVFVRVNAQIADSPLISNEEFAAGGVDSVRGYLESEKQSDEALAATLELRSPNLAPADWSRLQALELLAFSDAAELGIKSPLPGTRASQLLWSAGAGLRLTALTKAHAALMWAYPLKDGDRTGQGDQRVHFSVGYDF